VTGTDIPKQVKAFIADHIDSVVQLEILLLLVRRSPAECSAQDVAHELRIEPSWAAARLAELQTRGMLVVTEGTEPRYRYGPNSPALQEAINLLAKTYISHRVTVTALIFAKPPEALRSFADAFRIRKDRSNG
jgi:hypothetical protein